MLPPSGLSGRGIKTLLNPQESSLLKAKDNLFLRVEL
jgi:hypothetical protein